MIPRDPYNGPEEGTGPIGKEYRNPDPKGNLKKIDNDRPKNKSLPKKKEDSKKKKGLGSAEKTARRLARQTIAKEVRQIRQQREELTRAARNANATARSDYRRGNENLESAYRNTISDMAMFQNQATQAYDTTSMQQQAATAALQNQIGTSYDQINAEADLAGLGVGSLQTDLNRDETYASNAAALAGFNNASNLGVARSNSASAVAQMAQMAQGSYLSAVGQNTNRRNTELSRISQERSDQQALVRSAIREARGSRKDIFFQLMQQLKQSGWKR